MKRFESLLVLTLVIGTQVSAQIANPFQAINKSEETVSLSNGRYKETYDDSILQRIGSVVINTRTQKIASLLDEDSLIKNTIDNTASSRWYSTDPLAQKYPGISPYAFCSNNPIMFKEVDGRDFVYFDKTGQEVNRFKSNEFFKTYVGSEEGGFKEVPMPKIIVQNQNGVATTAAYQKNDYQIAASTYIFNQMKNEGSLQLVSDGNKSIPASEDSKIPNLDPTLVKAMTIQESQAGTIGTTDVMQTNNTGDWKSFKSHYGLSKGKTPDVKTSIEAGIKILATKGFKGGITYDAKTGAQTYNFQGWNQAVDQYNGNGVDNYGTSVINMYNNARPATPTDYSTGSKSKK